VWFCAIFWGEEARVFREFHVVGLRRLRGIRCDYCGHNTRLFSKSCGACYQRKSLLKRMPLYLLRLSMTALPLLVVALYLSTGK
jgi:DNA-directed RNA polymerase subunit RPC12/RpoP